jgi:hypothetical protein
VIQAHTIGKNGVRSPFLLSPWTTRQTTILFYFPVLVDVANTAQPYPLPNHPPAKGSPGLERVYNIQYDTAKEKRIFGIKLRTKEETLRDTLDDFAKRGW